MPGTNAGTGNPIAFACPKCRRRYGGISRMPRSCGWEATGLHRARFKSGCGPRADSCFEYQYRCLKDDCGFVGWSRLHDVRAAYQLALSKFADGYTLAADTLSKRLALFSPCERYRYSLMRDIGGPRAPVLFVMLNPSTATAYRNDPTVRRCIGYAERWHASTLYVANIFAYRSTDPAKLREIDDPVGPANDDVIRLLASIVRARHGRIVAAWGAHGALHERGEKVLRLLDGYNVHALALTKDGAPRHPLYLRRDLVPSLIT